MITSSMGSQSPFHWLKYNYDSINSMESLERATRNNRAQLHEWTRSHAVGAWWTEARSNWIRLESKAPYRYYNRPMSWKYWNDSTLEFFGHFSFVYWIGLMLQETNSGLWMILVVVVRTWLKRCSVVIVVRNHTITINMNERTKLSWASRSQKTNDSQRIKATQALQVETINIEFIWKTHTIILNVLNVLAQHVIQFLDDLLSQPENHFSLCDG